MALYNSAEELNKIMDILRGKMGISNMDQSKKLVTTKEVSPFEFNTFDTTLKQINAVQASQRQSGTYMGPHINPSDYDLNALMAEQARLNLCLDVAMVKLNQAKKAESEAAFACEQHMNLIKAVIGAMVENIKKVLK